LTVEGDEKPVLHAGTWQLPIHATIREVTLIEKMDGHWRTQMLFPHGRGSIVHEAAPTDGALAREDRLTRFAAEGPMRT